MKTQKIVGLKGSFAVAEAARLRLWRPFPFEEFREVVKDVSFLRY
jgi:pyruvate/2-oxoacid:ferredoxin oxidoreductase alpha subunit